MVAYSGNGNDVFEVFNLTNKALEESRNKQTPIFLEFKNYRFSGQYEGDNQIYQPEEEIENAKKNDPIKLAIDNAKNCNCECDGCFRRIFPI